MVASLMRELGLAAIQPRTWKRTTVVGEHAQVFPELLEGNFGPEGC